MSLFRRRRDEPPQPPPADQRTDDVLNRLESAVKQLEQLADRLRADSPKRLSGR